MEPWDDPVREDHRILESQMHVLEVALAMQDVKAEDRAVLLRWVIRELWATLELHLRKEEQVLFSALQRLLGEKAGAVTLMMENHQELRAALRRLSELLQETEAANDQGITMAADGLIEILEDHQKKEDRLLIDVLKFNLKPTELKELSRAYSRVAQKAYEEEGWPRSLWPRPPVAAAPESDPAADGHPQRKAQKVSP